MFEIYGRTDSFVEFCEEATKQPQISAGSTPIFV